MLTTRTILNVPRTIFALASVMMLGNLPASACYSGLTLIPTADTVAPSQYVASVQVVGTVKEQQINGKFLNTEFGVTPRVEAGVDFDVDSDAETFLYGNVKYAFLKEPKQQLAVAAGVYNIADGVEAIPYLVGTKDFGVARGHLGLSNIEDKNRWFAGVDRTLNDKWMVCADYTNGSENFLSLGANYQATSHFAVYAGVQFPNDSAENDTLGTIYLTWSDAFCKKSDK